MYRQQFWSIRQNPYANTNQEQMRELIISQNIITCPFGHLNEPRNNVINGMYNEEQSNSQDRKFIENINIGDIILIPFTGLKDCILARIVSEPIYGIDTGLFTSMRDGQIQVTNDGDTPFSPVGRKIQIIQTDLTFKNKRVLPMRTLSHINPNILPI
jgi:hypothetical protein